MAEAGARDNLQPALPDRLTDNDRGHTVEAREDRVISRTQLRAQQTSRLFNTTNLSAEVSHRHPLAEESTATSASSRSGKLVSSLTRRAGRSFAAPSSGRAHPPRDTAVRGIQSSEPLTHHNVLVRDHGTPGASPSARAALKTDDPRAGDPDAEARQMDPRMPATTAGAAVHPRGAEFAERFPKIAARLALDTTEVADPYVERLLEGFSFLCARVRLKLDAEFPRFAQHLLDVVYPHYLAPTPAMLIAQFVPTLADPALAEGFALPRGTVLRGQIARSEVTGSQFRTAHEVVLWPLELADAMRPHA